MIFPGPERRRSVPVRRWPARAGWSNTGPTIAALLGGLTLASALTAEPASEAASEHAGDVAPELLAAICSSCHRPDNVAMPVIHGRPAGQLLALLERFPGQRDVTVMHRLTVGLSGRELEAVAQRLAAGTP